MKLSRLEMFQFIKSENIKSIQLAFCDVYGREKNITIAPDALSDALDYGISISAASIPDFGEGIYTDLVLHPEPETLAEIPYQDNGDRAVRMFCSMSYPDGAPFIRRGTKSILKEAIQKAEEMGYEFFFGTEIEYYLFNTDEKGLPTKEPFDYAGYLDIAPNDKCGGIRREISRALETMDVYTDNTFHERGPGQNEITFSLTNPLTAGNNVITAVSAVRNAAAIRNIYADFSPKPLDNEPGSGMHINFSIIGSDGSDDALPQAVAGILDKVSEMAIFLSPSEDSYKRVLSEGSLRYVSWSSENRSQLFRLPHRIGKYRIAELRAPDPSANPYLIYALIIYASLYGIEHNLEIPNVTNFDLDKASDEVKSKYKKYPHSFNEACELAQNSEFIKSIIHQDIIDIYTKNKSGM